MPTGSGKSLCYQLAALLLPGTTLVVSPLIALMKDQVSALEKRHIPATFLNSSVPPDEMDFRLAAMANGDYKLVYIAPERFRNAAFLQAVARTELALLTIDEAHCISQWGHDFRPDYLNIRDALDGFPDIPILAVTATATPDVRADIRFVAHWDIPGSIEAYYQEVGRAGPPSFCELLFSYADVRTQRFFIDGANPSWNIASGVLAQHKAVTILPRTRFRDPPLVSPNPDADDNALRKVFEARREKERRDRQRLQDMINFCDTPGCRHKYILSYFGEQARADVCGGCDRCGLRTAPEPLTDAQWIIVQKVLSCVGRMKGEHAFSHVVNVLTGVKSAYVEQHWLNALSTWDILHGFKPDLLVILIETLIRSGCIRPVADGDDRVTLTTKGLRVARREEPDFTIRWPAEASKIRSTRTASRTPAPRLYDEFGGHLSPEARIRANALRRWRKEEADNLGIAAFRIMSNKTLFRIAEENPRTLSYLSHIVYNQTLNTYGEDILDVLSSD